MALVSIPYSILYRNMLAKAYFIYNRQVVSLAIGIGGLRFPRNRAVDNDAKASFSSSTFCHLLHVALAVSILTPASSSVDIAAVISFT